MVQKLSVEEFILESRGKIIIDVRSPKEFAHAHIPGAVSCPLFNDEERAAVGTLYKQKGRENAMMLGLEYYGKNMQRIIQQIKSLTNERELFVHCWRGGMRSGVVSWMLDLFGYKVFTLERGYKNYRNFVLQKFSEKYLFIILGGRTGAGKTFVLHELAKTNQVIDLEGLAHHKGSAFGALGETETTTQEFFENKLALQLFFFNKQKPIFLEDESQRVGFVNIPNPFWEQMRNSKVIYFDIPFETRVENLVNTYGKYDVEDLKNSSLRLQKRLGGLNTKLVLQFLDERNFRGAFSILLRYYDKFYDLGLEKREPNSIEKIQTNTVDATENAKLISNKIHGERKN